jgi:hypothetical protein
VSGRTYWPSRDPIEERGGANLYGFVRNSPLANHDINGLFTSGKTHDGVYYAGHKDFSNLTDCSFDFDLEDRKLTTNPIINPALHFQDFLTSSTQVMEAVQACDAKKFQSRMHRLQDYYTHYGKDFRWDPWGPVDIPGNGWGHAFVGDWPDLDNIAWTKAEKVTREWLKIWLDTCCECACEWMRKDATDADCDDDQPEIASTAVPVSFDANAYHPKNEKYYEK